MTATKFKGLGAYFSRQTAIAPLIVFRIIFGALLFFGTSRFLFKGWVEELYIQPKFHFGYLGFEWVRDLPGNWMYLPFILCLLASLGIIFGLFYRFSALLYFICFTYVELIDKTYYLNHYYFLSLMTFLMIWVPANRAFSLDVYWRKKSSYTEIPKWSIDILKFQIACVYFFAGLAKLNSDWLFQAEPIFTWLQAHHQIPVVGTLFQQKELAYLFSWVGCFYDLFIVFFLLYSKTRPLAYLFVVVFHLLTCYLFPIGIFPWVMIFATLIFFSDSFHQRIIQFLKRIFKARELKSNTYPTISRFTKTLLIGFVLIQLLVPFRYLLYPGNLYWTEEGFRFSWRVMLMHKEGYATFYVKDRTSGREIEINNSDYLTLSQIDQMATQPDMILQFAKHLQKEYAGKKLHFGDYKIYLDNPSVHANVFVSLNGRAAQKMVDTKHDLTQYCYNLRHRTWLEKF